MAEFDKFQVKLNLSRKVKVLLGTVHAQVSFEQIRPSSSQRWALEYWSVTLQPKKVISESNGPKIIQFDTKIDHSSSKNVSKIYVLYLRDFP